MTKFAASSHPGRKRDHNEDYYKVDTDLGLWLVADGVGGHADGEVASRIIGDTVRQKVAEGVALVDGVLHAHDAVLQEIRRREGGNMGSTVVALKLDGDAYEVTWVGDSRAYLYDGKLTQLTRDHNPVSELLLRGVITADQAATHPDRHVLSQSLGVSDSIKVSPGSVRGRLKPGQQIILCSDGLTDELDDTSIAARMRAEPTPKEQVNSLINGALHAGGRDNVTVIVIGSPPPSDANKVHASKRGRGGATQEMDAIADDNIAENASSHDTKFWLLLSVMGAVALLWVLLRIF